MEFFRIARDIPFMRHALVFNIISAVTFVLAVIFLAVRGLNLGVDFRGGTVIEVIYDHAVDFNRLRNYDDRLRMPQFQFARPRHHKGEADESRSRRHHGGAPRNAEGHEYEEDRRSQQRYVEAGDREDVIDAGTPKGLAGFRWKPGFLAEQQPGHEGG